jgi:hypothetical protein
MLKRADVTGYGRRLVDPGFSAGAIVLAAMRIG